MFRTISNGLLSVLVVVLLCSAGCDQLKQTAEQPPPPPPPQPEPIQAPVMPPPPPPPKPKTPEEVLADFLALSPYQRTDDHLAQVAQLPQGLEAITSLDLSKSPVTAAGLKHLTAFPELKSLDLSSTRSSDAGMASLVGCPKLETLILDGTGVGAGGMPSLAQIPTLRELSLQGTPFSDSSFTPLSTLSNIEVLYISGNSNVYGREFTQLVEKGAFSHLRELNADATNMGYYGLSAADRLKQLEVLRARQSSVSDAVLVELAKCPNLRILDLSQNLVSDVGVKEIAKLKRLEELYLTGNQAVTDNSFNFLKLTKSLKKLDVSNTSVTQPAVKLLAEKFLTSTDIFHNGQQY